MIHQPSPEQIQVFEHRSLDLLVEAPAGCGKTEALALRVEGILARKQVVSPKKVLVLTFSNRARDNIRERIRQRVGYERMRESVVIHNLHGLSARIYAAHANVIGLDKDAQMPTAGEWTGSKIMSLTTDKAEKRRVSKLLSRLKREALTDQEIERHLVESEELLALEVENSRRREQRLTYDYLPRYAELILENEVVAALYSAHFGAVIVDEFQDLTPQQLRVIQKIGYRRTTYAGDLSQAIYSFAGADPQRVYEAISTETSRSILLTSSHRSSPAVLSMVNAIAYPGGGRSIECADNAAWPNGGMAAICSFDTSRDEAAWSVDVADLLLQVNPNARVGIMARTKNRRREVDQGLVARCIEHCLWDDPIVDASVASIVRQALRAFDPSFDGDDTQLIHHLWALTRALKPYDIDTMRMVNDVFEWVAQQRTAGMDISELGSRIQVTDGDSVVKLPGIHLLNGHTGKGQQFDWALVVGLEQRNLPDYRSLVGDALNEERRVLSVMISRARLGIILSSAVSVPGWDGRSKDHDRSVFLDCFNEVEKITSPTEVTEWIQSRC